MRKSHKVVPNPTTYRPIYIIMEQTKQCPILYPTQLPKLRLAVAGLK